MRTLSGRPGAQWAMGYRAPGMVAGEIVVPCRYAVVCLHAGRLRCSHALVARLAHLIAVGKGFLCPEQRRP
ncbi:hypothetical protein GCM10009544_02860 [Streptomyces stramineus]|uniref:Uncharacterized protein n=1 Tax=Streptomyces stramineus TaxID=173861 RepID=A0ABN0ZCK5_9ACTN